MDNNRRKIAFLISGESRDSYIGTGQDQRIYNSHKQHIFNDELQNNYDYDVYIATDNTTHDKCLNVFGSHLKEIILVDSNKVELVRGLSKGVEYQFHKLYHAWQLMYKNGLHYDYVVRLRPDVIIYHDFPPFLFSLDRKLEQEIIFAWDMLYVGRYDIMRHICNHYNHLFTNHSQLQIYQFEHNGLMKYNRYYNEWNMNLQIPELQLCESAMQYITLKGKSITNSLIDGKIDLQIRNDPRHYKNNNYPDDYYSRDNIQN
jgi:hypothetical protein